MSEMLEKVELPSRGLYNSKYSKPLIIDMMDFECEKLVFGSTTQEAIDEVMKRLVKEPADFNPLELSEEDRMYLLWRIRIHSYGPEYHGYYIDEEGEAQKTVVNLEDMPCTVLSDDYTNPKGTLPMSKRQVEVKALTVGQVRKVEEYCKEKSEKLGVPYSSLMYEAMRARRIAKIDGKEPGTQEALDLLHSLKGRDLAYIDWLYNKIGDYGYKMYVDKEINGKTHRISISINGEFFRPDFDDISME